MKKYFNTKKEAVIAKQKRENKGYRGLSIFKMPKGSRKAGMFAVCTELEYLNTY